MDEARGASRLLWHDQVGSTQDEVRVLLTAGREAPFAVATDDQRGGRGRLGREWSTPPGDGLALTVAHRTTLGVASRSWIPLVTGLGAVTALSGLGAEVGLKWPNDLHDPAGRKLAGILAEAYGQDGVLVGIGVNLRGTVRDGQGRELPQTVALADLTETVPAARDLAMLLTEAIGREQALLDAAEGDALASGQAGRYGETCVTLGREVRVDLLAEREAVRGIAVDIDDRGRLVVQEATGRRRALDSGDVHHVRPT